MHKLDFTNSFLACATVALAFTSMAQAGANRTFVATTGNDSNTALNCGPSSFCRTFTAAISVTNSGGEIVVVDSGGYGAVTISQPVTISAVGIVASITATSGNAITITTAGNVTITGLSLHGEASGTNGIAVTNVGFLRLYNLLIENFTNNGIDFTGGDNIGVWNSSFNDNGHDGILLSATGSKAYIDGSEFDNNTFAGCDDSKGTMTVVDSNAHANQYGFYANGGTMSLDSCRAIYNTNGIASSGTGGANGAGALYFARCLISNNTTAWANGTGGILSGSSPGTTLIPPGQATSGSLSSAEALQ